jgi:hypothetical protein
VPPVLVEDLQAAVVNKLVVRKSEPRTRSIFFRIE